MVAVTPHRNFAAGVLFSVCGWIYESYQRPKVDLFAHRYSPGSRFLAASLLALWCLLGLLRNHARPMVMPGLPFWLPGLCICKRYGQFFLCVWALPPFSQRFDAWYVYLDKWQDLCASLKSDWLSDDVDFSEGCSCTAVRSVGECVCTKVTQRVHLHSGAASQIMFFRGQQKMPFPIFRRADLFGEHTHTHIHIQNESKRGAPFSLFAYFYWLNNVFLSFQKV